MNIININGNHTKKTKRTHKTFKEYFDQLALKSPLIQLQNTRNNTMFNIHHSIYKERRTQLSKKQNNSSHYSIDLSRKYNTYFSNNKTKSISTDMYALDIVNRRKIAIVSNKLQLSNEFKTKPKIIAIKKEPYHAINNSFIFDNLHLLKENLKQKKKIALDSIPKEKTNNKGSSYMHYKMLSKSNSVIDNVQYVDSSKSSFDSEERIIKPVRQVDIGYSSYKEDKMTSVDGLENELKDIIKGKIGKYPLITTKKKNEKALHTSLPLFWKTEKSQGLKIQSNQQKEEFERSMAPIKAFLSMHPSTPFKIQYEQYKRFNSFNKEMNLKKDRKSNNKTLFPHKLFN